MFFTRKSLAFSSEISHYPLCRGCRVGPSRRRERPLPLIRPRLRTKVIVMDKKKIFLVSLGHLSCDINGGALPAILPFLITAYGFDYQAAAGLMFAFSLVVESFAMDSLWDST